MRVEWIDDPADPRVAEYRDLPNRELRRASGVFVAEGRQIVARLLAAGRFRTRSILLTEPALQALASRLAPAALPVYVAPASIVHRIVGYRFHRGSVAVAERGPGLDMGDLIEPPGPRVIIATEGLTDPDNVGSLFRNAHAFGADGVVLSARCADPLYRKAIRVSVGASLAVPFARLAAWADGLARLRRAEYTLVALTPDPSAMEIGALVAELTWPKRVALLLGSEGAGLSAETRATADIDVRIAMAPGVDSLNVATAAGIALHRLRAG